MTCARTGRTQSFTAYKAGTASTEQFNRAFTWRLGGVYSFDNGLAPYASYARSFQPQTGSDYYGHAFAPTTGEQYEVGLKIQPKGFDSFITASLFHIDKNNVQTTDSQHAGFSVLTGRVRSQGVEIEAHANIAEHLNLIASYTYTNLLNTKNTTSTLNKIPVGIPRNAASLWADYDIARGLFSGLTLGAGVRYTGGSYGDTANSFLTSSATLVDLALRYDLGRASHLLRGMTVTFNASNQLDRHYLSECSSTSHCDWGMGRIVTAGLNYQW